MKRVEKLPALKSGSRRILLCNGIEVCNPLDGTCQATPALDCDDADPCTIDTCDAVLGCLHVPDPLCMATALATRVLGATPQQLGGAEQQAPMARTLAAVRVKVANAVRNPRRARRNYRRAYQLLLRFQRTLRIGIQRHHFDPELAHELLVSSNELMDEIQAKLKPSP